MVDKLYGPLTENALRYTWRQLAQRVGVTNDNLQGTGFEALDIAIYYAHPDQIEPESPSIIVVPCVEGAWYSLLERPDNSLIWLPVQETIPRDVKLPFDDSVPVLFWTEGYEEGHKPFAQIDESGNVIFYADIVAATFFMLTRWEETVVPIRDVHDRFPATASVAYKQSFLDIPLVDYYALILRSWISLLRPNLKYYKSQFNIHLSHDIDFVQFPTNLVKLTKLIMSDLLRTKKASYIQESIKAAVTEINSPEQGVFLQMIYSLADISQENNLKSSFYFMASDRNKFDNGYDLEHPLIINSINYLYRNGHEIGFHPGYYTFNNLNEFVSQKKKLDSIIGYRCQGGRQHYLRFRVPETWLIWEKVGMQYDSTMGYADLPGFRCGTCHPFTPYDIQQDREINLIEIPLVVMDTTLIRYNNLDSLATRRQVLHLAKRCKNVNGNFTLLWHNSRLRGDRSVWMTIYKQIVNDLVNLA